nr:hypothetical protein [Acinetobacter sp. CIP-A165]
MKYGQRSPLDYEKAYQWTAPGILGMRYAFIKDNQQFWSVRRMCPQWLKQPSSATAKCTTNPTLLVIQHFRSDL